MWVEANISERIHYEQIHLLAVVGVDFISVFHEQVEGIKLAFHADAANCRYKLDQIHAIFICSLNLTAESKFYNFLQNVYAYA